MSKYQTLNHAKFRLRYHIIFSTKYRRKCLNQIRQSLFRSLKRAEALQNSWKIELMELDKDHIHFLIKATPNDSVTNIVHKLKQISTYDMWQMHYTYLRKYYWKSAHCLWTRGYFCSTIGDVSEQKLKDYIEKDSIK